MGVEEERPLALGNFADSLVPLHGYRTAADLRSDNELWLAGKQDLREIYCGPGLWFNRQTGRIHIRIAHHNLVGLGERAYHGETDPRKLPLIVAVGFGGDVLRASGIKHVRLQDLVVRGATGIGPCLIPLTQHEIEKDESPLDHDAAAGVFFFRNVVDLRGGTYKGPPAAHDSTGDFLHQEGHLVGDHGGPSWPVMHVYHNTLLRDTPVFRDSYLFGLGSQGLRNTERDVFNNIFVQTDQVPGVGFVAVKDASPVLEGGNFIWGLKGGPELKADPFAKFRASPLFAKSREYYEPGWTTNDRVADPQFVRLTADRAATCDLRLQKGSPAIDAGLPVPARWPDPLREADRDQPDSGALPLGGVPWRVGVDGRLPLVPNSAP